MNGKRLIGWIIAFVTMVGPFRWAYLHMSNDGNTGAVVSFLLVLLGFGVSYFLLQTKKNQPE